MDMNESIVPHLKLNDPLIPREVMLSLGLHRPEKEEEIQRYHFMRLIASAKHVHLLYSDDTKEEKSRFIEELIWSRQKAAKSLDALPVLKARFEMKNTAAAVQREKNDEIVRHLRGLRYSSTKLNMYLDCPMRFYFQYVLGLQEKEDFLEEPEGVDIGIFIHEVLNTTYARFLGKQPAIDKDFETSFYAALDHAFDQTFNHKMKSDAFLLKEVVRHRMQRFLEHEKTREVREILYLEKSFTEMIVVDDVPYAFEARMDRIDRLADGTILVIDYKTGSSRNIPGKLASLESMEYTRASIKDNITSFQLPLYIRLIEHHFPKERIDAAIYDIRTTEIKRYFIENDDESRRRRTAICAQSLEHILKEITSPEVPFVADTGDRERCHTCPFFNICR
jgi:ATP-dependent helicase/DNAse subunit B